MKKMILALVVMVCSCSISILADESGNFFCSMLEELKQLEQELLKSAEAGHPDLNLSMVVASTKARLYCYNGDLHRCLKENKKVSFNYRLRSYKGVLQFTLDCIKKAKTRSFWQHENEAMIEASLKKHQVASVFFNEQYRKHTILIGRAQIVTKNTDRVVHIKFEILSKVHISEDGELDFIRICYEKDTFVFDQLPLAYRSTYFTRVTSKKYNSIKEGQQCSVIIALPQGKALSDKHSLRDYISFIDEPMYKGKTLYTGAEVK